MNQEASSAAVTSEDIRLALRLRFPERSHALLFEVADASGSYKSRFADAIAVGLWPSHGHRLDGLEIKISRGDFLREMRDPTKSEPIYQFCHRYWLCCPKGMVQPTELPETWGLLEYSGGTLRERKKATQREPVTPSFGFLASLLRRKAGYDEEMQSAYIKGEIARVRKELDAKREADVEREVGWRARQTEEALAKLEQIKSSTGIDLSSYVPTDRWIEAMRFLQSNPGFTEVFTRRGLSGLHERAAKLVTEIESLLERVPNEA